VPVATSTITNVAQVRTGVQKVLLYPMCFLHYFFLYIFFLPPAINPIPASNDFKPPLANTTHFRPLNPAGHASSQSQHSIMVMVGTTKEIRSLDWGKCISHCLCLCLRLCRRRCRRLSDPFLNGTRPLKEQGGGGRWVVFGWVVSGSRAHNPHPAIKVGDDDSDIVVVW